MWKLECKFQARKEFEKNCKEEVKIYIYIFRHDSFCFTEKIYERGSKQIKECNALTVNQYYIKNQFDFFQLTSWMCKVEKSLVKSLAHIFMTVLS